MPMVLIISNRLLGRIINCCNTGIMNRKENLERYSSIV